MTFHKKLHEHAVQKIDSLIYDQHGQHGITPTGRELTKELTSHIIQQVLNEVQEVLGETWKRDEADDDYIRGEVNGRNFIHRKVTRKIKSLRE